MALTTHSRNKDLGGIIDGGIYPAYSLADGNVRGTLMTLKIVIYRDGRSSTYGHGGGSCV